MRIKNHLQKSTTYVCTRKKNRENKMYILRIFFFAFAAKGWKNEGTCTNSIIKNNALTDTNQAVGMKPIIIVPYEVQKNLLSM